MIPQRRSKYTDSGIVLQVRKYSERKLIVDMLTLQHGRITTITSISKNTPRPLFQPFYILDFIATPAATTEGLHTISEAQLAITICNYSSNATRSTIVMMLSELMLRVVRDSDESLFHFTCDAIRLLYSLENSTMLANFHLHFMVKLSEMLGYAPHDNYREGSYFDIALGSFVESEPRHNLYLDTFGAQVLHSALERELNQGISVGLNGQSRSAFLSAMVDYYGYHTESIYDVRSIEIFSELF